jgi:hypothetical protein
VGVFGCGIFDRAYKQPNADAITMVYLPNGPTAYFKLTSIEPTKKISVREICEVNQLERMTSTLILGGPRVMHVRQRTSLNSF